MSSPCLISPPQDERDEGLYHVLPASNTPFLLPSRQAVLPPPQQDHLRHGTARACQCYVRGGGQPRPRHLQMDLQQHLRTPAHPCLRRHLAGTYVYITHCVNQHLFMIRVEQKKNINQQFSCHRKFNICIIIIIRSFYQMLQK